MKDLIEKIRRALASKETPVAPTGHVPPNMGNISLATETQAAVGVQYLAAGAWRRNGLGAVLSSGISNRILWFYTNRDSAECDYRKTYDSRPHDTAILGISSDTDIEDRQPALPNVPLFLIADLECFGLPFPPPHIDEWTYLGRLSPTVLARLMKSRYRYVEHQRIGARTV
ncbi:MAG: hypothetical protein KIT79_10065 [Deltaproteobacteria bacterium]|nr:hypothetical protein [Deltaproteobacteria bacterium]